MPDRFKSKALDVRGSTISVTEKKGLRSPKT